MSVSNLICPYCNFLTKNLKQLVPHISCCVKGPKGDYAKLIFYVEFYKYSKEDFLQDYLCLDKSLLELSKDRGIPYKVLKFFAVQYSVFRDFKDRVKLSCIKARKTLLQRYATTNPSKTPQALEKINKKQDIISNKKSIAMKKVWKNSNYYEKVVSNIKKSIMSKYGVENVFLIPEYQNKGRDSIKRIFGVDNISQSDYKKNLMVSLGRYIPDSKKSEYDKYKEAVKRETYKWSKNLYAIWLATDGLCYYTFDSLLDENGDPLSTARDRPSIDHKVSVLFGFLNHIPSEVIGNINNLCVCSSKINGMKRDLTEYQFRKRYYSVCFAERYFYE